MTELLKNPILNVLSLALAVVSILLAWVFYRRSRKFKEPTWASRGRLVLSSPDSELRDVRVFFRDEEVRHVSIDRVIIWNAGRETITRPDIVTADPLRIECQDDGRILDVSVVAVNNAPSDVRLKVNTERSHASVEFEYLDEGQGAVVQVINTSREFLTVRGSLKGAQSLRRTRLLGAKALVLPTPVSWDRRLSPRTRRLINRCVSPLLLLAGVGMLVELLFVGALTSGGDLPSPADPRRWAAGVVGGLFTLIGCLAIFVSWGASPPTGLDTYDDDLRAELQQSEANPSKQTG